jgi:Domain of unknown function (DUF222)
MSTAVAGFSERVQSGAQQIVSALRDAATEGIDAHQWTELLAVAFTGRNQIDSAVTSAIGAFDKTAEASRDNVATLGLSPARWLSENLGISSSAAYAQVHLAKRLPSLPATAQAFERGELSGQHASVISQTVESVQRGGGDIAAAETLMLQQAASRDPRGLHRWGLSLVHRLAPRELEDQEERMVRNRYVHLRELFHGGYQIEGYLDPVGGATLKAALEGVLGPRQKGDDRTPGQRRAAGLIELAARVLDSGQLPVRAACVRT